MNNRTLAITGLIALTILASGCIGQTQDTSPTQNNEDTNLTANQWCQQNNHGEAVKQGCVEQSDLLGNTTGEAYYAVNNSGINCAGPEAYVCSE